MKDGGTDDNKLKQEETRYKDSIFDKDPEYSVKDQPTRLRSYEIIRTLLGHDRITHRSHP